MHHVHYFHRAFIAWEEQIPVSVDKEHEERQRIQEYKIKLNIEDTVLPDPFTLTDGWLNESQKTLWPNLYFIDIADYLRIKTAPELYHKLCNEYKLGKGFRL